MSAWHELSGQPLGDPEVRSSRRRGLRPAPDGDRPWWAFQPKVKNIEGFSVEVFGIATTSRVMGISPVSQRRWEGLGLLPPAPLRLAYPTLPHARRLYTGAMVETLASLVMRHDVGPRRPPTRTMCESLQLAWSAELSALALRSTVLTLDPIAA